MPVVAELGHVEGFTVEAPWGTLGIVEATRPGGLVLRTTDGARLFVGTDAVRAVDPDARQVLVGGDAAPAPEPARPVESVPLREERPIWQILAFALACIVVLALVEIGLAFGVALAVTGHMPY